MRIKTTPTLSPDKLFYEIYCDAAETKPVNYKDMATGSTCAVIDKNGTKKLTVYMWREDLTISTAVYGEWVEI